MAKRHLGERTASSLVRIPIRYTDASIRNLRRGANGREHEAESSREKLDLDPAGAIMPVAKEEWAYSLTTIKCTASSWRVYTSTVAAQRYQLGKSLVKAVLTFRTWTHALSLLPTINIGRPVVYKRNCSYLGLQQVSLPPACTRPAGSWKGRNTAGSKKKIVQNASVIPHSPAHLSLNTRTHIVIDTSSFRLLTRPLHLRPKSPHLDSDSLPTLVRFNPDLIDCDGAVYARTD
jgi:hypothetical protein